MSDRNQPSVKDRISPQGIPVDFTSKFDTSTLKNKSILITGGASGIGLACAKSMAEAGAFITVADMQLETGTTVAKDLSSKGLKIQFVHCDAASYPSQSNAFIKAVEFGGNKLDIVVPCAGIVAQKNIFDMTADEPQIHTPPPEPEFSGVDVNLKGVYYSSYLALHYFRLPRQPEDTFKKSLVLISSMAGYLGYPHSTTYSMSKFGVRGLFWGIRTKAADQAPPVRVNLVAPWFVETPMIAGVPMSNAIALAGFTPVESVTDAVLRLGVDENIHGRAVGCLPDETVDLEDELGRGCGGLVVQQAFTRLTAVAQKKLEKADENEGRSAGKSNL